MNIIEQELIKNLNDVTWTYSWIDNTMDKIISNISTVKSDLNNNSQHYHILDDFEDILNFKIKQVYDTLMKLHSLQIDTTTKFYKKYHGPFRDEIGKGVFEEVKREITYTLEAFLTQLKSLMDLSIKFAFELSIMNNTTKKPIIDSLGSLIRVHKKTDNRSRVMWNIIKSTYYFSDFIKQKSSLSDIQNYRDIIIHERYLKLNISNSINNGEILFQYKLPVVTGNKKNREVSNDDYTDVIIFSRKKLHEVLSILEKFTNKLFDKTIKEQHFRKLLKFDHNDISKILCKMSARGNLGEEYFPTKDKLDTFLLSKGIDPNELVEYDKTSHESKHKKQDWEDKTIFVHYIPIDGLEVYSVESISNHSGRITRDRKSFHIRHHNSTKEEYSKIENYDEILKHLQGYGVIYASHTGDKKFMPLENNLKQLIYNLLNLNQEKWTIQLDIHKYINPLSTVEEWFKKSYGDKFPEFKKKEERELKPELERYEKWKKDPHYDEKPITTSTKKGVFLNEISYQDYKQEKKVEFVNWYKNKIIRFDTKKTEKLYPIFPTNYYNKNEIDDLIKFCNERWKKKPYNFTHSQLLYLKRNKQDYEKNIIQTKQNFKNIIYQYRKLKPFLKLINNDIYSVQINYNLKQFTLFSSVHM